MMPFRQFSGVAAPLPIPNVDTDKIFPGRFLKTVERAGLGAALFADLRRDPTFMLNRRPWTEAQILVALDNFGCGSSREHAPWALLDFGIRCIIAPSIADIFYNNCVKNGVLPVILANDEVNVLLEVVACSQTAQLTIDLEGQRVTGIAGEYTFAIDPQRKQDLLTGQDEINKSLEYLDEIDAYERVSLEHRRWLSPIVLTD